MDRYNGEYDDIITGQRPFYERRAKMSMHDRAAQFAPFAALTGFDAQISETARLTDRKPELSDRELYELNIKAELVLENIASRPEIEVIYFTKDPYKEGGAIDSYRGIIKKYDRNKRIFVFEDCKTIPADDIIDIHSDLLEQVYKAQNREYYSVNLTLEE